jgi:hypothetical protein
LLTREAPDLHDFRAKKRAFSARQSHRFSRSEEVAPTPFSVSVHYAWLTEDGCYKLKVILKAPPPPPFFCKSIIPVSLFHNLGKSIILKGLEYIRFRALEAEGGCIRNKGNWEFSRSRRIDFSAKRDKAVKTTPY